MQKIFRQVPDQITILLLSLLLIASALLLWAQSGAQHATWLMPLGIAVLLLTITLIYTAGWRMYHYYKKLTEVVDDMQQDRKRLQQQVALGNSDLEKQKAMLLAFKQTGYRDLIVALAADFMNVSHAAFLQLNESGEVMECIQASSSEKYALIKGTKWKQKDFPTFFNMIEEGKVVMYPDHLASHRTYRAPLGNLLHYIENNHIKSLLVMSTGTTNGTTGIVWFEDREQAHKWDERAVRQAEFVSGIVHLELVQELQQNMIGQLSEGVNRLEVLRDFTTRGWAWYELDEESASEQVEAVIDKVSRAVPLEQNPHFMALAPKKHLHAPIAEWIPNEALQKFIEQKYTMPNYEFSLQGESYLVSMFGVLNAGMLKGLWLSVDNITAQKQKEATQAKIIAHLSNVVTEVDADNKIVFDSQTIAHLGFSAEERKGKALPSFLHHEDIEKFELALWKARREQIIVTCPYLKARKNEGGYIHFDAKIYPSTEENHLTIEFVEAATRAAEQEKMQASQDFLKRLLAHSHELVAVINQQDQLSYVSGNIEELFGYKMDDRLGRYALEYFHKKDAPKLIRALERLQEGEIRQYRQEAQFLHRNGKWRKVQVAMHAIYEQNKLTSIALRVEDISEERKDIDLLRNRENLLAAFMSRSSRSYWLVGAKGQIRYTTNNVAQLMGFEQQELVGKQISPLIKSEDTQAVQRNLQDWAADPNNRSTIFITIKHKDGTWKPVAVSHLGSVENEHYAGLLLSIEEPLGKGQVIDSQIDLRADFFQAVANSLPMPVLFADKAWAIKYANEAMKGWLGFTPAGEIKTLFDAKSIKSLLELEADNALLQLRMKDKKGNFWQVKVQAVTLKGSVVKGKMLLVLPQSEEVKVLEKKLSEAEQQIASLKATKAHDEGQKLQWEKEYNQLQTELEELKHKHSIEVEYLNDRIDLVQSALVNKNATILSLETKLQLLEELKDRGRQLQKNFEDLRELLYMFDDIGQEVDWRAKWQEIQHFKQLINYEQALKQVRKYITDTQVLLSDVTSETENL